MAHYAHQMLTETHRVRRTHTFRERLTTMTLGVHSKFKMEQKHWWETKANGKMLLLFCFLKSKEFGTCANVATPTKSRNLKNKNVLVLEGKCRWHLYDLVFTGYLYIDHIATHILWWWTSFMHATTVNWKWSNTCLICNVYTIICNIVSVLLLLCN